jgi:hypothetical protein
MTKKRFRRGGFSQIQVKAPSKLISQDITPQNMTTQNAQDIQNMLPRKKGELEARNGFTDIELTGIPAGEKITELDSVTDSNGDFRFVAYTDAGKLYTSDTSLTTFTSKQTGLDTNGTPRFEYFAGGLTFCNGIDDNLFYDPDADTFSDMGEYVEDALSNNFAKVDTDTFTLEPATGVEGGNYPDGRAVRVYMDGSNTPFEADVLSTSYSAPTLTVNLDLNVLTGTTIDSVEYYDKPPAFSLIRQAHDRLWALSGGELKANQRRGDEGLKYFYLNGTNNPNTWFNPTTQAVGFVNAEDKHLVGDEFVGIELYRNNLVFFGRRAYQIWTGTVPTSGGDLSWGKTVGVGCAHGSLIQEVENDLIFYTNDGAQNLEKTFQTDDIEVSQGRGAAFYDRINDRLEYMFEEDDRYKAARSFKYSRGGFVGFKVPDETHIYTPKFDTNGWVRFTGLFSNATALNEAPNRKLYVARDNAVFVYDEDNEVFSDDGESIAISWWTPEIEPRKGHRWANRYTELQIVPEKETTVTLKRYKDFSSVNKSTLTIVTPESPSYLGEFFLGVDPLGSGSDIRNYPVQNDKYIARSVSYAVQAEVSEGGFRIVSLNMYGKAER